MANVVPGATSLCSTDPSSWSRDEVQKWARSFLSRHPGSQARPEHFDFNGKALALLKKRSFVHLDALYGEHMYNELSMLAEGRNSRR